VLLPLVLVDALHAKQREEELDMGPGDKSMSKQALWQEAWSQTLEKYHAPEDVSEMGTDLQDQLYGDAQKLWKSWLQVRHQRARESRNDQETDENADEESTSTLPAVALRLLAGVNSKENDEPPATTTTTTTTENPEATRQREQLAALQKMAVSKLTQGMAETREEEIEDAKEEEMREATSTTSTTTTTFNQAIAKLLAGVNAPVPSVSIKETTTTTTTTTTTPLKLTEAGRKTIAFLESGTFSWPRNREQQTKSDDEDDDEEDSSKATTEGGSDSEAATDFDQYDN